MSTINVCVCARFIVFADCTGFGWCLCNLPLPHLYDLKQTKLDLDVT